MLVCVWALCSSAEELVFRVGMSWVSLEKGKVEEWKEEES